MATTKTRLTADEVVRVAENQLGNLKVHADFQDKVITRSLHSCDDYTEETWASLKAQGVIELEKRIKAIRETLGDLHPSHERRDLRAWVADHPWLGVHLGITPPPPKESLF